MFTSDVAVVSSAPTAAVAAADNESSSLPV